MIIGNVECRLVSFLCQLCEYLIKSFDDDGIFDICNWDRKNEIGVVIFCDKIYCMPSSDIVGSALVASVYKVPAYLLAIEA